MAAALLLLAGSGGCKFGRQAADKGKDDKAAKEEQGVPVEITHLERGAIEAVIKTSTHLEAEQEVKVLARTSNLVTELHVEEGDFVKQGDLLLQLADTEQRTTWEKAKTQFEKAQEEFGRQENLYNQNLVSEQVYKEARFNLDQNRLAMEEAELQLDYTRIAAPISGTISGRHVNLGGHVSANQHLFDIVDFESLVARIHVPEKHLPEIAPEQRARVTSTALGTNVHPAFVRRIAPVVDPKTGLVKVTLGFRDPGPLRPGMYVEADLVIDTHPDAVLIPKRAIVYDEDRMYAYRLRESNRVDRVLIEPLLSDKHHVEPVSGFREGDPIVIAGQTGLKDGALVELQEEEAADSTPEATSTGPATSAPPESATAQKSD